MKPRTEHWVVLGAAVALLAYAGYTLAGKTSVNADLNAPQAQPMPDEFTAQARLGIFVHPDGHQNVCLPEQHHAGYVYTPHRFPRSVGPDVTNAIHRGFSSMRIPGNAADAQWIIAPPSEVMW